MREIKFRAIPNRNQEETEAVLDSIAFYEGSESYDGTFIYGNLSGKYILGKTLESTDEYYNPSYWVKVDKSTIGQYTGLKDKNGKEIYEGDIFNLGAKNIKYIVEWIDTGFMGRQSTNRSCVGLEHWKDRIEVIGNIYENPELMEVKQ